MEAFWMVLISCVIGTVISSVILCLPGLHIYNVMGAMVLGLLAYYALFAALIGAMAAALDTTAGERERGSLEPLLTNPAAPLELAAGKWLALCVLDALVVAVTLGGFYLTLRFASLPSVGIPFLFGFRQYAAFIAILAPLILLATAVLLYVGLRGRSVKEAQASSAVLILAVSLLPLVGLLNPGGEERWHLWVPALAQNTLMTRVLKGEALGLEPVVITLAVCAVLALLGVGFVARVLRRAAVR